MRISDIQPPRFGYDSVSSRVRSAGSSNDAGALMDISSLSLPGMLALTASDHPQREAFLAALSRTLRNSVLNTSAHDVAASILTRGFDSVEVPE